MLKARTFFEGEQDKRAYVAECETAYEADLDAAVAQVLARADCHIVTLSGPTCSGKTTTARKLISEFSEAGRKVHVVSLDDFYYDREVLLARTTDGHIDFDSPSTIDMDAFAEAVQDIFAYRPTHLPKFDFKEGRRIATEVIDPDERDVYIFEGIQAIYPEVTAHFEGKPYLAVVAYAEQGIELPDIAIDRTELRLLRRLVRDYNFRGASPEFTLKLWQSVRSNEDVHILPYLDTADVHINSTLAYELSALKPYLVPLLRMLPTATPFSERAEELLSALSRIDEISKTYIPKTSVYREFLG